MMDTHVYRYKRHVALAEYLSYRQYFASKVEVEMDVATFCLHVQHKCARLKKLPREIKEGRGMNANKSETR